MTPIAIATEDELSEAVAMRLIAELQEPHYVTHKLRKGGFGYLRSKMDNWCQMAQHQVMLVLTDLDQAKCAGELREQWLSTRSEPARLLLRVAVREVESWVLADHAAMRVLIGPKGTLPPHPDELLDPKQALLRLANCAPRGVRDDLLRVADGRLAQGLGIQRLSCALGRVGVEPGAGRRTFTKPAARTQALERSGSYFRKMMCRGRGICPKPLQAVSTEVHYRRGPCWGLNVNVPRPQRVGLNEVPPRLHLIPHQHGEHAIRLDGIVDLHAQQAAHVGVHGGFPQLLGVHFAQALVALAAGGAFGFADEPVITDCP